MKVSRRKTLAWLKCSQNNGRKWYKNYLGYVYVRNGLTVLKYKKWKITK